MWRDPHRPLSTYNVRPLWGGGQWGRMRQSMFGLSADGPQQEDASHTEGRQLPEGQWMTQSYADQIPDISKGQQEGGV